MELTFLSLMHNSVSLLQWFPFGTQLQSCIVKEKYHSLLPAQELKVNSVLFSFFPLVLVLLPYFSNPLDLIF